MASTPTNCGASTGTATATASGGTGTLDYLWSPSGGTVATASNLASGPYTVTITDDNNCQVIGNVSVSANGGPSISVSSITNATCFNGTNGTATVSGSGGSGTLTYSWMPGSLTGATQNTLAANTYTVTVTDGGGCSNSTTVTIGQPAAALAVSMSSTPTNCGASTGSATAAVSGGTGTYDYIWSPSGGIAATASNLASGPYSVTITDDNNCQVVGNVSVSANGGPSISVVSTSDVSCNSGNDGSATVSGSGGSGTLTYSWMPGSLTGTTQSTLTANTYTVTVTDGGGCSNSTTVTINEPTSISLSSSNIISANCSASDGSATVNATGGSGTYLYAWSPVGGNGATASNIPGGLYNVIVTDQEGCSENLDITVPTIGGPTITLQSSADVTCFNGNDGTATVLATGGSGSYTYSWAPSGGAGATASNLNAGTYDVTVTDGSGCSNILSVTIGQPTSIVITETIIDANCGSTDGQISTSVNGGTGTYTYDWAPNGEITPSINNLSGGSYSVLVTDSDGCTATETYTVQMIGTLPITVSPISTTIQAGESVQLNASGATSYTWTPSTGLSCTDCPDPIASPTTTTIYTVTGTDASGCIGSASVTVAVTMVCGEIYVPTVFAPSEGGSSANNKLCVYGNCIAELNYSVYNRWGEKVFETTDPTICWDGKYKDKDLNSGVFAYKLQVTLIDGNYIEESGNVTLIR
jgi:gliding motility-associated-like protein